MTERIYHLELTRWRRGRVWLGCLPADTYAAERTVSQALPAAPATFFEVRRAAVELFVPTGPRSMYGLLGGELVPDSSGTLKVEIRTSSRRGAKATDSLEVPADTVLVGLPEEYVRGVVEGITAAADQGCAFESGTLTFTRALHGLAGSSEHIFARVSRVLLKILFSHYEQLSEQEAAALLEGG